MTMESSASSTEPSGLRLRVPWGTVTATDNAARLARIAGRAASDKLGTDIIVTGNNERQVEAIVDEVEEQLRKVGVKPLRREGKRDGRWVLLDYAEIVVHVQHAEERVFYSLERLWKDCPIIEFDPDSDADGVSEGQSAHVSSSEL
jgi:ribosome-associated protein